MNGQLGHNIKFLPISSRTSHSAKSVHRISTPDHQTWITRTCKSCLQKYCLARKWWNWKKKWYFSHYGGGGRWGCQWYSLINDTSTKTSWCFQQGLFQLVITSDEGRQLQRRIYFPQKRRLVNLSFLSFSPLSVSSLNVLSPFLSDYLFLISGFFIPERVQLIQIMYLIFRTFEEKSFCRHCWGLFYHFGTEFYSYWKVIPSKIVYRVKNIFFIFIAFRNKGHRLSLQCIAM